VTNEPPNPAAWTEAIEALERRLTRRGGAETPPSVPPSAGITGAPGAGKSSVARALAERHPGSVVISTDRYLPDYDGLPPEEYDRPERADLGLLRQNIADLRARRATDLPVWSFETHARVGFERTDPPGHDGLLIIEGIHALAAPVRGLLGVLVFVDAPLETRARRVVARERAGERGWSPEDAEAFLRDIADPTFAAMAGEYRAAADVIVWNDDESSPS